MGLLSNIATNEGHGENSSYFDGWKAYETDPFHKTRNPNGVIQMGLAENQLCHDLIQGWIKSNPKSSICTSEGVGEFQTIANFQDYHGLPAFRQGVAKFMEKVRGGRVGFDPDRIVMSGGATGAQEIIAFCLADPGDAFLIPTPYYPGFDRDFVREQESTSSPSAAKSTDDFRSPSAASNQPNDEPKPPTSSQGCAPHKPLEPSRPRRWTKAPSEPSSTSTNSKRINLVCDEIFAGDATSTAPDSSASPRSFNTRRRLRP
ncbi:uncharacterized protein A4U43_C10F2520 [Asparagus officinalis]|uniref:1-aminocyclopropane-1-carboxylate synthase n=1 Tax=Asparagus officinalis TaxID=4686 RepID=A0A5P1E026_ASPOF|nr:uncharacterized protein A4U43_C10F2520 [Asparagus officinalis]